MVSLSTLPLGIRISVPSGLQDQPADEVLDELLQGERHDDAAEPDGAAPPTTQAPAHIQSPLVRELSVRMASSWASSPSIDSGCQSPGAAIVGHAPNPG
jgi:hypothetical protein